MREGAAIATPSEPDRTQRRGYFTAGTFQKIETKPAAL
jgi:hypothetical protein